nr:MAG TPA_asm: Protein of unknown function (DUF1566) [Bacteriophage sp.]
MAIKTRKISDWLSANGQAITNASKATMEDAIRTDIGQLYDGVFIMFHRKSDDYPLAVRVGSWASYQASGEIAEGILLAEGGRHLVIAPTEASSAKWSSKPASSSDASGSVQISGVTTTGDRITALNDFAGRTNTTAIINGSTSSNVTNTEDYAAGFCNRYSRTNANGKGLTAGRWWSPSMGEMAMIWANFDKINYALSKIDGATQLQTTWYWTSTQGSAGTAWYLYLGDGYMANTWKFAQIKVRPVSAFLN